MTVHAEKASELFIKGYNCAQAVFAAFCDVTGYDEKSALLISSSFGAGMGRMREVCGALSGMFMAAGVLYASDDSDDSEAKKAHYERIQELAAEFRKRHETIICRELLKELSVTTSPAPDARTAEYYKARPCLQFVVTAAEILDDYISSHPINK